MEIKRYENFDIEFEEDFEEDFEEENPEYLPYGEITRETPIGTKVIIPNRLLKDKGKKEYKGKIIHHGNILYGVEFDDDINGHGCDNRGKYGHCWYLCYDIEHNIIYENFDFEEDFEEEDEPFLKFSSMQKS